VAVAACVADDIAQRARTIRVEDIMTSRQRRRAAAQRVAPCGYGVACRGVTGDINARRNRCGKTPGGGGAAGEIYSSSLRLLASCLRRNSRLCAPSPTSARQNMKNIAQRALHAVALLLSRWLWRGVPRFHALAPPF